MFCLSIFRIKISLKIFCHMITIWFVLKAHIPHVNISVLVLCMLLQQNIRGWVIWHELETGKSKSMALVSGKGLHATSSHGKRWKDKRVGDGWTSHSLDNDINPFLRVEPSCPNYLLTVPPMNTIAMVIYISLCLTHTKFSLEIKVSFVLWCHNDKFLKIVVGLGRELKYLIKHL